MIVFGQEVSVFGQGIPFVNFIFAPYFLKIDLCTVLLSQRIPGWE